MYLGWCCLKIELFSISKTLVVGSGFGHLVKERTLLDKAKILIIGKTKKNWKQNPLKKN